MVLIILFFYNDYYNNFNHLIGGILMNEEDNRDGNSLEEFFMSDLVNIIYKSYKSYLMYKIADLNITPGQIPFILELMRLKKASQDDLSDNLFLTRGATAKTLRKLDDKEIIERKKALRNRRKNDVFLTDKGKEAALEIEKIDKSWEENILSHLEDSEFSENLKSFEDKKEIIKLLRCLAKSSIAVFSEEMEKIRNSDDSEDFEMPPFAEFPFRGHHFRGPIPHGNFFKRPGHFGKEHRRK